MSVTRGAAVSSHLSLKRELVNGDGEVQAQTTS